MSGNLVERLQKDGLLKPEFARELDEEPGSRPAGDRRGLPHLEILKLCNAGALEGGLSVALDVRPDELIGPLCQLIGGSATTLRVVDVRDLPMPELRIQYGELEEPWEIEDLYALVNNLNDLLRGDSQARAVAILGEWQDMLQLWCVSKASLGRMMRQDYFAPRNRHQLESLAR